MTNKRYQELPPYLPIRTVVKFHDNDAYEGNFYDEEGKRISVFGQDGQPLKPNPNPLMSKTLMKTTFIDNSWLDQQPTETPKDEEFWLTDIVFETSAGKPRGCFIAHPIRKVDPASLNRLLPGMYDETRYNGLIVLEPKTGGHHWILPLTYKWNVPKGIYATIVKN